MKKNHQSLNGQGAEYALPELNRPSQSLFGSKQSLYGSGGAYSAKLAWLITLRPVKTDMAGYARAYSANQSLFGQFANALHNLL